MGHEGNMSVSPKASFALGLVGGVLVLCTIGFFVLLGLMINGQDSLGYNNDPLVANDPTIDPVVYDDPGDQVGEITPINDSDHAVGPTDAAVTLFVYSDFECPYCGRFHLSVKQLIADLGDQVQVVFRNYPLSFHPNARPAANAAECAGEQGKFWEFADGLFEDQSLLGASRYKELATRVGLNVSQFDDCVAKSKFDAKISSDLSGGMTAGVQGTPGTIIVGSDGQPTLVPGAIPYEQLKGMVQAVL
ncbi:MAG: thioredoxin domain-containing protein [bacterium]